MGTGVPCEKRQEEKDEETGLEKVCEEDDGCAAAGRDVAFIGTCRRCGNKVMWRDDRGLYNKVIITVG